MSYQQNPDQQNFAASTEVAKSPGKISQILATQDLIGLEIGTISGQQQQSNQQQISQQQQINQQQQISGQQSELEQAQGQMSQLLANQARQ